MALVAVRSVWRDHWPVVGLYMDAWSMAKGLAGSVNAWKKQDWRRRQGDLGKRHEVGCM